MGKTYAPKISEVKREWFLMDAKDKILGRLAARVATILRGKHKPMFALHVDTGDGVVVINAAKVRVTGRKMDQKIYRRYSGYPGGLREVLLKDMLANKPEMVIKLAVKRMLPGGPMGSKLIRKLRVYADDKHSIVGQALKPLELKG